MTLLFIEDDQIIRDNFRNYLNSVFNSVYEVSDGKNAFLEYEKVKPDVILLDINLPSVDGISIAKKIRTNDDNVSIIILSAIEDRDILIEAVELHLTKYLLKPVSRSLLQEVISKVVHNIKDKKSKKNIRLLKNNYTWNEKQKKLYHNDNSVTLTKNEVLLLECLCLKPSSTITSEKLYDYIYNDYDYNENKIRMLIKRLRAKTYQDIIINIYGVGFKLNYL